MRTWILLLLLLLALAVPALANPPAVLIPSYSPGYNSTDDLLQQVLEELRGLRADLQRTSPQQASVTDGASVIRARCAACHRADVADDQGASVILVEEDNTLTPYSVPELRRIKKQVETGKMPLGSTLSPQEKQLILAFVSSNQPTR